MKDFIVIHHSLTHDGKTVNWNAIRRYHVENRGWDDVGYHFGIEKIGDRYEILMGRMPHTQGAHTRELSMNTTGIGICCVGNFDLAPPPPELTDKLVELLRWLCHDYRISSGHVIGHCEVGEMVGLRWQDGQYKTCPGRQFDMGRLRSFLS